VRVPISQIGADVAQSLIASGLAKLVVIPPEDKAKEEQQRKRALEKLASFSGKQKEDIDEAHRLMRLRAEAEDLKHGRKPNPEKPK